MKRVTSSTIDSYREHKKYYKNCQRCALGSLCKASERVFFRGIIPCTYLFVGEAPGESELCTLEPFTGRSGSFLDSLIEEALGKNASKAFVNTVICAPRDARAGKLRSPKKNEMKECSVRLHKFIKFANPTHIIAVGKQAEYSLNLLNVTYTSIKHPSAILQAEERGVIDIKRVKHILTNLKQC